MSEMSPSSSASKHAASPSTHLAATQTPLPTESRTSLDEIRPETNGEQEGGQVAEDAAEPDSNENEVQQGDEPDHESGNRIAGLEAELDKVTHEKNTLESQYRNLLGKLTNMRNTLGDKLRQDAEELDRREQQIVDLQANNEDLQETIETLKSELIGNNEECERLHAQAEQLRSRADDSAKAVLDESSARDTQLREVTEDLERCRLEREDWETQAMKERVERETLETSLNASERELVQLRHEKQMLKDERDREAESAANLHAVLEEFQAAKDKELKATLGDMQNQLHLTSRSLQEYRQRAQAAETKLTASQSDSEKSIALAREVKEKSLQIGKLRHEAVILNEHLTEALRRLRKDTSENNVDRRLVTNVLITFFNTPRADSKRFEMLSLLSSILSWSDDDREKAGLQRTGAGSGATNGAGPGKPNISLGSSRRRAMSRATNNFTGKGKGPEESFSAAGEEGLEQSFSNLWVEYLLRESNAGSPNPDSTSTFNLPPLPSPNPSLTSPNLSNASRTMSPFAELMRPRSPSKSSSSGSTAGKQGLPPPLGRQRSGTETSESVFSRSGETSTAATSVASGL